MLRITRVPREQACPSWDRYVVSHPGGSGYHLMAWRRVMERSARRTTFYLMATDMRLGACAIGASNIDTFARMTGIDFHVEGAVGQFALGRGAAPARSD